MEMPSANLIRFPSPPYALSTNLPNGALDFWDLRMGRFVGFVLLDYIKI
jgi:hypothetical protein